MLPKLRAVCCLAGLVSLLLVPSALADGRTNNAWWYQTPYDFGPGWTDALANGALVWDNVWYQCHNFRKVTRDTDPVDIWVYKFYIDGPHGTYGYTTDNNSPAYDSGENWHLNVNVSPGGNSLDAWSVVAHEMGHTLWIDHFGSAPGPTMSYPWPGYYGQTWARTLESGDKQHIQALYPTGSC